MKICFSFLFLLAAAVSYAQPAMIKQAIVYTTTNIIAPEEEDVQNLQSGSGQGGGMNFRNMMDGETKFITYLKDEKVKTVIKNEMGRSTIIRENDKKLTTTLIEMMGSKMGFYITDEEQVAMQKRRDSMMQARRKNDTSANKAALPVAEVAVEIAYTEETRKIAGYECKKAYVISTRLLGLKDSATVWFSPEIKLQNIFSTGGMAMGGMQGFGNMAPALGGLDKINGFVMRYEMNMRRNRKMEVEVTKIDLKKDVEDKEFLVPKDFEVKPMKEMENMFRQGGFQNRRGG